MNIISTILILVCLAVGTTAGYFFGARKVDEIQARVDQIISASKENRDNVVTTEKAIKQAIALKKAKYLKKEAELKKLHKIERQNLDGLLASRDNRISALNDEKRKVNENLVIVTKQLTNAKGRIRNGLREQRGELVKKRKSVSEQKASLECLDKKVPIREILKLKKAKS